jgi:ACGX-repeat protein
MMNKLSKLGEWSGANNYTPKISAQSYLAQPSMAFSDVGSACGAADPGKKEEKPSACGSACGAGDPAQKEEKPSACGSACGTGDPAKK